MPKPKSKPPAWKPPKVTVVWLDACRRVDLYGTKNAVLDLAKLVRRESVGYLLRHDDALTVLCNDYDPPEEGEDQPRVGDVCVIPSGWVLSVKAGRKVIPRESAEKPAPEPEDPGSPSPA